MNPIRRGLRPNVVTSLSPADVETLESRTLMSVGSVAGTVFNDANVSYTRNPGEAGIPNVRVYIDANNNGRLDTGETSVLTNAAGTYRFANLNPGSYVLREVTPAGYRPTSPWQGFWRANVGSGQNLSGFDFGNTHAAAVSGTVFRDTNGNGVQNPGETGLAGWRVYVDANNNGRFDAGEISTVTNATGGYSLTLNPGTYRIREVVNSGFTQTSPAGGVWVITLANGQILTGKSFGNKPNTIVPPPPPPPPPGNPAKVFGSVFSDANGNGVQDAGDAPLVGWRVYADLNNNGRFDSGEPTFLTNSKGIYELDLSPGTYHVREVVNTGYTQTSPAGGVWTVTVGAGWILTGKSFGNKPNTVVPPPPPPPPPPPSGAFVVTSTRAVDTANPADDIVTFFARNPGTGVLAGTREILGEDATLSSAGGLVIRANSSGVADFAGVKLTPTQSYVGLGSSMFVVSTSPNSSGSYHDMQTVRQFEVVGLLIGGVLANSGAGAKIAVAIVPHNSAVALSGLLGAESGPEVRFSASA